MFLMLIGQQQPTLIVGRINTWNAIESQYTQTNEYDYFEERTKELLCIVFIIVMIQRTTIFRTTYHLELIGILFIYQPSADQTVSYETSREPRD